MEGRSTKLPQEPHQITVSMCQEGFPAELLGMEQACVIDIAGYFCAVLAGGTDSHSRRVGGSHVCSLGERLQLRHGLNQVTPCGQQFISPCELK